METDNYNHTLAETCCDVCKKKTQTPTWLKVENKWLIWFYCSAEHAQQFRVRDDMTVMTIH